MFHILSLQPTSIHVKFTIGVTVYEDDRHFTDEQSCTKYLKSIQRDWLRHQIERFFYEQKQKQSATVSIIRTQALNQVERFYHYIFKVNDTGSLPDENDIAKYLTTETVLKAFKTLAFTADEKAVLQNIVDVCNDVLKK